MAATTDTTALAQQNSSGGTTIGLLILLFGAGLMVWRFWDNIKDNNIFSKNQKYNYGRSEEVIERKRSKAFNLLGTVVLLNLAGIAMLIYQLFNPVDYTHTNGHEFTPETFFLLSLMATLAAFICNLADERIFAEIHNINYTLKVWLSTVCLSPLLLLLMDQRKGISGKHLFSLYFNTAILAHGISIITLVILMYAVHRFTELPLSKPKRRLYILLIAEGALLINMYVVAQVLQSGPKWLLEVLPFCVVIGLCIWFYPMDKTIFSEVAYYDTEIED